MEVLRNLDENLRQFASSMALLTPWSLQVPASLSSYHGVISPLVATYLAKTEGLVSSTTEVHEHSMQLLEALTKIFPPGEGDPRLIQLLSVLACTYPTRDSLYKLPTRQSMHFVYSQLFVLRTNLVHLYLEVLRQAPVLYSAAIAEKVASLGQSLMHQNSVLHTLAS